MSLECADYPAAKVRPSPNFGERVGGRRPDIIILHYTGMTTGEGAEDWLCNPQAEVSSHYLVHESGEVVQMVAEADRAWHAGKSFWAGETDINSCSVGIEIVNPGHFLGYPDFPEIQIASVIDLCRDIAARHAIRSERILAHSDVAPGRKIDPGEKFPWDRLARSGVGHWVDAAPVSSAGKADADLIHETQRLLRIYGYGIQPTGLLDDQARIVIEAFQRHFRPALVDGQADRSTLVTLQRLLEALPII